MPKTLDPYKTVLVIKCNGKQVGKIAATAQNADAYVEEKRQEHQKDGEITVDYVQDESYALVSNMRCGMRRQSFYGMS